MSKFHKPIKFSYREFRVHIRHRKFFQTSKHTKPTVRTTTPLPWQTVAFHEISLIHLATISRNFFTSIFQILVNHAPISIFRNTRSRFMEYFRYYAAISMRPKRLCDDDGVIWGEHRSSTFTRWPMIACLWYFHISTYDFDSDTSIYASSVYDYITKRISYSRLFTKGHNSCTSTA